MKHIESRHFVTDVAKFKKVLGTLGFEKLKKFKVTDHMFMPKGKKYNLSFQQMKIRVREDKTLLIYRICKWINKAKYDYIRISKELKFRDALDILKRWNFEKKFAFSRTGTRYEKDDIVLSLENINHIGHIIEIEAPSVQSLDKTIRKLDFISDKIPKSVPALVYDKIRK
jgi:adenylate cyclase class IV